MSQIQLLYHVIAAAGSSHTRVQERVDKVISRSGAMMWARTARYINARVRNVKYSIIFMKPLDLHKK
jgi:hypothetical protein